MPDASQVSAGASAVLIIVILIFNFSARRLGNWVYRRITASR